MSVLVVGSYSDQSSVAAAVGLVRFLTYDKYTAEFVLCNSQLNIV